MTKVSGDQFKKAMFSNIHCINFMYEQRITTFQMMGAFDGAMSNAAIKSFKCQYEMWDSLIDEFEAQRDSKTAHEK